MIVDKIKKRQGFAKELIIDEALDFLQDEKFGDFIAYLYRTFRKKEGSITLAAQNILFLKNMPSSIKDSIIINCATKIILDHSEHRQNLPEVKAVLSITDEEAYMIESLQRTERWREFFIKMYFFCTSFFSMSGFHQELTHSRSKSLVCRLDWR